MGSDEDPYNLAFKYTPASTYFLQYLGDVNTFPHMGLVGFTGPRVLPNENLKPQNQSSFEVGADLRFFGGKIRLDMTYYSNITKNQIVSIDVPLSTGYFANNINAGKIANKGVEVTLGLTPVETRDFKWDLDATFASNKQTVEELAEGLDEYTLTSQAGYGGTNRYEELMDLANAKLVVNTTQKLDVLSKRLYIQSKSFDDVIDMCKNHDEMLKCIPAIQPISNKDLRQTASGYGTRIDPIYGTTKFHAGMDFSAHPGTDVYATGNGTVVKVGWETGYGNTIEIDHGFGYLTRYAHLQGFNTKVGKKVVRGEIIGKVGSTGKSTGPHLHYEVHVKGQVVNPVNYYFMDLSAEDYEKMIQLAANHGKVFD